MLLAASHSQTRDTPPLASFLLSFNVFPHINHTEKRWNALGTQSVTSMDKHYIGPVDPACRLIGRYQRAHLTLYIGPVDPACRLIGRYQRAHLTL